MADIRRFSDNALIANGTSNNELGMTDIVPVQHTSGNNIDYKMSISQFQGTPVVEATYTTATSPTMAYNGTCKNFPDIGGKLVQGQHVLIKFLRNNTSTNVTKTTINLGGYTYELQLQGSAMPTGYIAANAVIDFTCLTATSDTTKTGVLVCQNSVSQVNSALAEYKQQLHFTITSPAINTELQVDISTKGVIPTKYTHVCQVVAVNKQNNRYRSVTDTEVRFITEFIQSTGKLNLRITPLIADYAETEMIVFYELG